MMPCETSLGLTREGNQSSLVVFSKIYADIAYFRYESDHVSCNNKCGVKCSGCMFGLTRRKCEEPRVYSKSIDEGAAKHNTRRPRRRRMISFSQVTTRHEHPRSYW
eukprot:803130-Prorocentrum_minimum.AAC.1